MQNFSPGHSATIISYTRKSESSFTSTAGGLLIT